MRGICFWAAVAALCACAEAKGSAGATSGGSYRSSRAGHYSRTTRYSYGYFFLWHGGAGRTWRSTRGGAAPDPNSPNKVFCRRDVRVDTPRYVSATEVSLNSTRLCFNQESTVHGAPENTLIESVALDVYQFKLQAGQAGAEAYPAVEMTQLDDKDQATVRPKSFLRLVLRELVELDPSNATVATHDLRGLTWKSVTAAPADKPVFGWPVATQRDLTKLTSFAIEASSASGDMKLAIVFALSDDFAEVPFADRIFFRPSGLVMRLVVEKFPFASDTGRLGLNAVLGFQATLPHFTRAPPGTAFGAAYNATEMDRVEVGTVADTEERGRHFFSWRRSANNLGLCMEASAAKCRNGVGLHRAAEICTTPTAREATGCQQLGLTASTVKGVLMEFVSSVNSTAYGPDRGAALADTLGVHERVLKPNLFDWSLTLGTFDPSEAYVPEPAFSGAASALPQWAALAGALLLLLVA